MVKSKQSPNELTHDCEGPVVFKGDYKILLNQKKNNPGITLKAHGVVHVCKQCGWNFAMPGEGLYANLEKAAV